MASVNFLYRSLKDHSCLNLRLLYRFSDKDYVIASKTNLEVSKDYWKNKHKVKVKDISIVNKQIEINSELNKITNHILKAFTKSEGSDPTVAANQDRLTSNVWITRGNDGGQFYNIIKESIADKTNSPVGTKWAIGTLSQIETLSFTKFRTAVSKPKDAIGKNLVMYLVDDDTYLSVKITSWSEGKKGGFAYERSSK